MKVALLIRLANIYMNIASKLELLSEKYYKKSTDIHLKYKTSFGLKIQSYMNKTEAAIKNQKQTEQKTEKQRQEEAMKQYDMQERNKIAYMFFAKITEKEKKIENKSKETSESRNNS